MKIKINRNILWAEIFVNTLTSAGVRYACISPGSRSTPLTYVLASDKKIKSYVHIDERSGAFFATGLARKTGMPVVLVCTSGTAVAEFYPAIIEAFQQRIPLIVCTADRPTGSFLKGINQTINQNNIYSNHIRWFVDAGLPDVKHLENISKIASRAVTQSQFSKGPVHINFPFDKPFEPDSFTDEIDEPATDFKFSRDSVTTIEISDNIYKSVSEEIIKHPEGLITAGPSDFPAYFRNELIKLSRITGYPILADGASQLRFGNINNNVIVNYDALFRCGYFQKNKPSVIIHFGSTMTSKGYEDFIMNYTGSKYLVNRYDEVFDPAGRYNELIPSDEEKFITALISRFGNFRRENSEWLSSVRKADTAVCHLKEKFIHTSAFPDESRIITEVLELLPDNSNLMLSNSSPVRDFDYFAELTGKNIHIFHNRGASGIDGITSTALGIAANGEMTVLITGDLAFYYDMNGLLAGRNYNIPLIIILINNNGGGIFKTLPVSGYPEFFDKYFTTPHNLSFENLVKAYGADYTEINNWEELRNKFKEAENRNRISVLEIRTDSGESLLRRKKFWNMTEEIFNDNSAL